MKKSLIILVLLVSILAFGCANNAVVEQQQSVQNIPAPKTISSPSNVSLAGDWKGGYDIGVEVGAVCTNTKVLRYSGPIVMHLLQSQDKLTGDGSISGVNNVLMTAGDCTPQDGGAFDMKITGSIENDGSIVLDMDFGDPDMYFPKLHFVGTLEGKDISGTISGKGIAESNATFSKQ
jgi:hypothetical protein